LAPRRITKELRNIGNHPLKDAWNDYLIPKVFALLESMEVKWTSMEALRMGIAEVWDAPTIVWIGVMPGSLSGADGVVVASKCRELLVENGITGVDVEIREPVVTCSESALDTSSESSNKSRKKKKGRKAKTHN
jgi:hypothetical protein